MQEELSYKNPTSLISFIESDVSIIKRLIRSHPPETMGNHRNELVKSFYYLAEISSITQ